MADLETIANNLSELTVMEAAEVFFGHATHTYRPKR